MGGPLDRLGDVVTGVGGAVQAPFGLVWDLARAPFVDDDVDGILGTINAVSVSRFAQFGSSAFGPNEGLGAALGGLPETPRGWVGGPLQAGFGALEAAGREGIRQPLATLETALSLAESPTWQGEQGKSSWAALIDPDTWQEAYRITQDRSVGQAFALMLGTKDILDEEETERFMGTDSYAFSSGLIDGTTRLFLEPDMLVGKFTKGARAGKAGKAAGRVGRITTAAPPQLGRRAEQLGLLHPDATGLARRVTQINTAIDRAYVRLPEGLQRVVFSERDFDPNDLSRLERLDATRRELGTATLQRRIARSTDPTEVDVLTNIVESRRVREARMAAGQTGRSRWADTFARQAEADIDAYFATAPMKGSASRLVTGSAWQRVNQLIDSFPTDPEARAGLIRDRIFPTLPRGDIIAQHLAEAQGPAERQFVMRIGMGDMRAVQNLEQSNWALARRMEDLQAAEALIRAEPVLRPVANLVDPSTGTEQLSLLDETNSPVTDDWKNYQERLARIGEEMDAVVGEKTRADRLVVAADSLPLGPTVTRGDQVRNAVKSSSFFQTNRLGKALRLVTDMRPHNIVDTHDNLADSQLARMLTEAGYDEPAVAQARGNFMSLDPQSRGASFQRWVERAEAQILKDNGLDSDEISEVLSHALLGKRKAGVFINGAIYDAEGRYRLRFHDGDEMVDMPGYATQLQNLVTVPNLKLLRKSAERYARLKYGDDWRSAITRGASPAWTMKQFGLEGLREVMAVWRPTVLLRPAWTMRVVGDEQLRMIAKFGALSVALGSRNALNNYMARLKKSPAFKRVIREDGRLNRKTAVLGAASSVLVGGPIGGLALSAVGNKVVKRMAQAEERGYTNLRFGGHSVSGPFGDAGSRDEFWRGLVSARGAVDDLFGKHESRLYRGLTRDSKRWTTHMWGVDTQKNTIYRNEWANVMRGQIGGDPMARQFLAGKSADEVLDWLDNTLEGRRHAALLPWRYDHEAWVQAVADQVQSYTGGIEDVKRGVLAAGDDAAPKKWDELLDLIPEGSRAPIHGAVVEDTLGARSPIFQAVNGFVDNAFEILGTMATDEMSRNPAFSMFYQSEMRRQLGKLQPGQVHESQLARAQDGARAFALREVRELLYDMAERSQFGEMVRTVIPFFSAWQEVLTRWAGLAVENPVWASRMHQVWNAPDRMGWTYQDDRGNNFLRIRIPEFAAPLVNQGMFKGALDSQGYVFLDKRGFNLVAQGTPGAGPIVQWAASEMVKAQPSLEDSVKFIIPFGPTDSLVDAFTPPTVRRAFRLAGADNDEAFMNAEARILTTKLTQMQQGDLPMVDMSDPVARKAFLESVHEEARQFMMLKDFTSFVSPVAPMWESPYKPYVDVYRALRDGDYERAQEVMESFDIEGDQPLPKKRTDKLTADDVFLDSFGEEFFALTQAFTQSVNGIPPTIEAMETSEKYSDLVTRYPEWAGVVAGYEGGTSAQFSRAVYDRQLARGERRRLTPEEILSGPDERLGWSKYAKVMDLIDTVRVARGLPNLNVKAADDLRQLKKVIILALASKHPTWFAEFSITDQNKWNRRIEGARAIAADDTLAGRPDIAGLRTYLALRDSIAAVLSTREQTTLSAQSNQDLATAWATIVNRLTETNPEFAELYYRKLESDPMTLTSETGIVQGSGPTTFPVEGE